MNPNTIEQDLDILAAVSEKGDTIDNLLWDEDCSLSTTDLSDLSDLIDC